MLAQAVDTRFFGGSILRLQLVNHEVLSHLLNPSGWVSSLSLGLDPSYILASLTLVGVTGFMTLGLLGPLLWPGRGEGDSLLLVVVIVGLMRTFALLYRMVKRRSARVLQHAERLVVDVGTPAPMPPEPPEPAPAAPAAAPAGAGADAALPAVPPDAAADDDDADRQAVDDAAEAAALARHAEAAAPLPAPDRSPPETAAAAAGRAAAARAASWAAAGPASPTLDPASAAASAAPPQQLAGPAGDGALAGHADLPAPADHDPVVDDDGRLRRRASHSRNLST